VLLVNRAGRPITTTEDQLLERGLGQVRAISASVSIEIAQSYSQNIGAIALTGVGSRVVVTTCGVILVVLSFLPGVSLATSLTPSPVIGGALLFLFGTISVLGIQTAGDLQKPRDRTIFMVSLALGPAVSFAGPALTEILPAVTQPFLGEGIIVGTIAAVTLNILLPDPGSDHVGLIE
jgi:xanthine/uracil permease